MTYNLKNESTFIEIQLLFIKNLIFQIGAFFSAYCSYFEPVQLCWRPFLRWLLWRNSNWQIVTGMKTKPPYFYSPEKFVAILVG